MSEVAPEAPAPDFTSKLEALAAEGYHLVFSGVERFIIEKVDHVGTAAFEGKTLEEVIGFVEDKIASHPGAPVTSVSRSDGTHESVDLLGAQAGRPDTPDGPSGVSDAPHAEVVEVDPPLVGAAQAAAVAQAVVNTGAGENVVSSAGTETLTDPSAQAAATAAPSVPTIDPSGTVSTEPGEIATGVIGTPADAPEPAAEPAPEGAVES